MHQSKTLDNSNPFVLRKGPDRTAGCDAAGVKNRSSNKKGQRMEGPNEELQSLPVRQEHEMGQFSWVLIGLQNYQDNRVPIIHTKNDCCPLTEATGSHMSSKQQQTTGFTFV